MEIRQDDFFNKINERSTADEILEGILLSAQREHQEKKVQFYGNLIANIAFDPSIDREQANFLIKLDESLSYRQICLLSLFVNKDKYKLKKQTTEVLRKLELKRFYYYKKFMILTLMASSLLK